MILTIYFYKYPNGDVQEWKFFHNEFDMSVLPDKIAQVYKHNNGAIIKEINIRRV